MINQLIDGIPFGKMRGLKWNDRDKTAEYCWISNSEEIRKKDVNYLKRAEEIGETKLVDLTNGERVNFVKFCQGSGGLVDKIHDCFMNEIKTREGNKAK